MKRLPFAVLGLLLPDLKGRLIRAVTENAYMPLNFVDPKTGKAMGWEYGAVNEIARRLKARVQWNVTAWDTMIQAVREGQYDVGMDGITITDERRQQVDFSEPNMVSQQFMLVRKEPALTNFYVAVYLFETFGAAVQPLIAGDVDCVLMDAGSGRGYVGVNPEKLKVIGEPLGTEEFGFIFQPGSDLVAPFNAAIRAMKADGALARLDTKWFFEYSAK